KEVRAMQVRIRYLRRDEAAPRVLELSPEEYFDPLDEGETLTVRSVARCCYDFEYTGHRAEDLWWTVLEITDGESFWRGRTQPVDGLRSLMHHTHQSDGSEEIIHQAQISPCCWHTIRTLKRPGKEWAVVMNNLTAEEPGKEMLSRDFGERWSFEQLNA